MRRSEGKGERRDEVEEEARRRERGEGEEREGKGVSEGEGEEWSNGGWGREGGTRGRGKQNYTVARCLAVCNIGMA